MIDSPEAGRRLRDEGMQRVSEAAHPAWKAAAGAAIIRLAQSGEPFGAEDVTAIAGLPSRRNAVGALFSAYAKRGVIAPEGYEQAGRASRHASRQLVWRGTDVAMAYSVPEPDDEGPVVSSAEGQDMTEQWFAIIHGRNRTRYTHLFATSVDHPRMKGATTACGVDANERFPGVQIGFGVYDDAERCPSCTEKESEWSRSMEQAASSGSSRAR